MGRVRDGETRRWEDTGMGIHGDGETREKRLGEREKERQGEEIGRNGEGETGRKKPDY